MGYVYEDENEETVEEVKEEKSKKGKKDTKKTNAEFIVDNLMTSPEEEKKSKQNFDTDYTVDNLLDSEESRDVYLNDLLNKKDVKLFNAYLGKNYKKITEKSFNFAAFFFGGSYLIYRKIYGIGAFILALCLIVEIIFPIAQIKWYITVIFELLASLACGLFANQIILNNAASKILNLKMQKVDNIKVKLARIGGTNILLFFIAVLISSGILSVFVYNTTKYFLDTFKSEPTYLKYDGQINANESINIRTLLDISVPEGYKTGHANAYQYSFIYNNDANIAIDIVNASGYESESSLIKDILTYEGLDDSSVDDITTNDTTWHHISTPLSVYAVGVINNKIYFIRQMHRGKEEAFIDFNDFLESIHVN